VQAELDGAGGAPMKAKRDAVVALKQVSCGTLCLHLQTRCQHQWQVSAGESFITGLHGLAVWSDGVGTSQVSTDNNNSVKAARRHACARMQDLQETSKEAARQRALLAAAAKTDKALAAECSKKEKEHATLEDELEALLALVGEAGERGEELAADVAKKEAVAAAARDAYDALFEQACFQGLLCRFMSTQVLLLLRSCGCEERLHARQPDVVQLKLD
jgi:hypothetical protein